MILASEKDDDVEGIASDMTTSSIFWLPPLQRPRFAKLTLGFGLQGLGSPGTLVRLLEAAQFIG